MQNHREELQRKSGNPQGKSDFLLGSATRPSPAADFDWFPPPVGTGNPAHPCQNRLTAGKIQIPQRQGGFLQRPRAKPLGSGRNQWILTAGTLDPSPPAQGLKARQMIAQGNRAKARAALGLSSRKSLPLLLERGEGWGEESKHRRATQNSRACDRRCLPATLTALRETNTTRNNFLKTHFA